MKLKNMNVYAKTKVLSKFGSLEKVCVEMRQYKISRNHLQVDRYLLCSKMKGSPSIIVNSISLTIISIHQELNYFQMSFPNKEKKKTT